MNSKKNAEDRMSLEDVGPSPLVDVLAFLSIQDICSAAQTCRLFREASKVDRVWRRKAQEIYPSSTLSVSYRVEGSGYSSYLDLLRDDNAANSSLYLPLEHASCDYKYNSQGSHYEARVTALQLHRDKDRLLVCFDAIGEDDLRSPLSSSMALCVHRPHMNRFRLRMEMESIRRRREALEAMRSAPGNHMHGGVFSNYEGRRLHDCKVRQAIQSCIIMENDIYTRLIDAPALDFKDLLMPLRPLCQTLVVDVAGHRKGILEFEGTKFMEEALARASNSHFMREEIKKHGIDLVFCYANRLPVMPEHHMVDYYPVQLVHIPYGCALDAALRMHGATYVDHGHALRRLQNETEQEEELRWLHLPRDMVHRGRRLMLYV